MEVVRYDTNEWPDKAEITPDGFLRVDAPITRMGVLKYRGPDGSMRGELRHPDDWSKQIALDALRSLPVTNDHPPPRASDGQPLVDARSAKNLAIGWNESVRADGDFLRSPVVITDADGIAAVQRGRRGTSTGVLVTLQPEKGVYRGDSYDFRQIPQRGNHIAIVDSPRAGTMIRLDSEGHQISEGEHMETKTFSKVVLDGIPYDAAPEVANALTKSQGETKDLKARLDTAATEHKTAIDRLTAEKDTLQEKLDAAGKRDIASEVKARVGLETSARKVLPETEHAKLDGMSDADIRKAVVATKWPELKLDDKSADYIATRFEIAIEEQVRTDADGRSAADALAESRGKSATRVDGGGNAVDEAAKRAEERIANQWKPKAA